MQVLEKKIVRIKQSAIQLEYYTSIEQLPIEVWNQLAPRKAVGLEANHLRAIEESGINDIHPYYFIGYNESEPIGIAYCFVIQVNLAQMANSYPEKVLSTIKTWKPGFMNMRIIEMGHLASVGSTIEVNPGYKENFLSLLSETIDQIAKYEEAEMCIIRDIDPSECNSLLPLEHNGYLPAMGYPIAKIPLKWNSFEGYLSALKTKKRYNIRKKKANLLKPEITVELIDDYAPYAERLATLWTNVAKRQNGYEHERLTPAYFESMARNMKGRSHVLAIKCHGEIVAFGLNLVGDEELFGVAEGIDYELRDQYDLYANNIFEGLKISCQLGMKSFNIGITTYDFKTSIGAELFPSAYLVKSFKEPCYSAVWANFIQKNIEQPNNHHRAFLSTDPNERIQLRAAESIVQPKNDNIDPFARHYNYVRIDTVRASDLYTYCPVFESAQESVIIHNGRKVIMLGTNSYLGLATHPKVKEAAHKALDKYGTGCSGSPLLNGTLDIHRQLATELAQFSGKQDALIFSTGYQTNVGVIAALANRDTILLMDERNHASLVDGARLSGATLIRYRHNDISSLENLLIKYNDKPKLVVTDTLFSMEGTIIDLPAIVKLVKKYSARLMLDESHAIGVMGPKGRGIAELYGLTDEVDVIMGTFSKSLASVGGFIAADQKLVDTLKHTCRSHIFSASLPPASVAAVMAALQIIEEEPWRREKLLNNARYLSEGLTSLGYTIDYHGSAIIPLHCGHELLTVAAFHKLFEEGVYVNPVTSPAVPRNQEMLRISLMATHDESMLLHALDVFKRIKTPYWPEKIK